MFFVVLFLVWLFPKKDIACAGRSEQSASRHCGRILLISTCYAVPVRESSGCELRALA